MKIREGKAFGIVQFGLGIGIHGISVGHVFANIHAFCRQGYIERIGRYSRIENVMLIYPDGGYELLTRKQFEELSKESK